MLYQKRLRKEFVSVKVGEQNLFYPGESNMNSFSGGADPMYNYGSYNPAPTLLRGSMPWYGKVKRNSGERSIGFNAESQQRSWFGRKRVDPLAEAGLKELKIPFFSPNAHSSLVPEETASLLPFPSPASHRSRPPLFFHSNPSSSGIPSLDNQVNAFRPSSFSAFDSRSEPLYSGAQSSVINSTSDRNTNIGSYSSSVNPSSINGKYPSHSLVTNAETFNIFHSSSPSLWEKTLLQREEYQRTEDLRRENLRAIGERRLAKEREEQERKEKEWKEEQKVFRERQALVAKELEEIKREQAARQPVMKDLSNINAPPKLQATAVPLPPLAATVPRSSDVVSTKRLNTVEYLEEQPIPQHLQLSQPVSSAIVGGDLPLEEITGALPVNEGTTKGNANDPPGTTDSHTSPLPFSSFKPTSGLLAPIKLEFPARPTSILHQKKQKEKKYSFDIKTALGFPTVPPVPSSTSSAPQQLSHQGASSSHPVGFFPPRRSSSVSTNGSTYLRDKPRLPSGKDSLKPSRPPRRRKSTKSPSFLQFRSSFFIKKSSESAEPPPRVPSPSTHTSYENAPAVLQAPPIHLPSTTPPIVLTPPSTPNAYYSSSFALPLLTASPSTSHPTSPSTLLLSSVPLSSAATSTSTSESISFPPPRFPTAAPPPVVVLEVLSNPALQASHSPPASVGLTPGVSEPPTERSVIPDPSLHSLPPTKTTEEDKIDAALGHDTETDVEEEEEDTDVSSSSRKSSLASNDDLSAEPSKFIGD